MLKGPGVPVRVGEVGVVDAAKVLDRPDVDVRPAEGVRVVQLTPPGSACSIVFGTGLPTGAPLKGCQFVVADIATAAEQLTAAGVEHSGMVHFADGVQTPGRDPQDADFGTFVFFDDPDGNTWSVQQGRR